MSYPLLRLPYPPSNNVYYRHSGSVTYLSKKGKEFKEKAGWIARQAKVVCLEVPVSLIVILHPKRNKDGTTNKTRMDIDNCLKAVFDSLEGIAFVDDSQVARLVAEIGGNIEGGGVSVIVKPYVANSEWMC